MNKIMLLTGIFVGFGVTMGLALIYGDCVAYGQYVGSDHDDDCPECAINDLGKKSYTGIVHRTPMYEHLGMENPC